MKIEVETKYEIGQKVYVVNSDILNRHFATKVSVYGFILDYRRNGDSVTQCVRYYLTLPDGTKSIAVDYCDIFADEADAQAEANRLNELRKEKGK